jgi:hypothetical protein
MSNLSRRSIVASVAALPALAVPAVALAVAAEPDADAGLLRLGSALERVGDQWLAQRATDRWEDANNISVDPDLERWGRINERLFDLVEEIFAHKAATTLAGLAVQTHAIALANSEWWDDWYTEMHEEVNQRNFVDCVCTFLNITSVPMQDALARSAVQS